MIVTEKRLKPKNLKTMLECLKSSSMILYFRKMKYVLGIIHGLDRKVVRSWVEVEKETQGQEYWVERSSFELLKFLLSI